MTTAEVVEKYYDCINSKNWTEWIGLFSEDVVRDEQLAGHYVGIDALRGAVTAISEAYSLFIMTPVRTVIDGGAACVVLNCHAKNSKGVPLGYREDGKLTSRQVIGVNYFQVQNGKIVYLRTIHDSVPFNLLKNE
jgi:ketosteroid isomerase-like protein